MLKEEEEKPHVTGRPANRVSSAVWPLNVQRVVATGRAAQRRRDWIIQGRKCVGLSDILPRRVLQVITTLLVVANSLIVAVLGLRFWFLLPLPLLLFLAVLALPLLLASNVPLETIPSSLSRPVQQLRSPTAPLPSHSQEPHSHPSFHNDPRGKPGLLTSEAPATPKPAGQPLVRVLETYDLRQPQTREQRAVLSTDQGSRQRATTTEALDPPPDDSPDR
jgi:hypothetical protein